ncbi:hypothetical protein AURDEDRAFT_168770 [Auricularia subglabra TFB-10046 SS5]|nr:hypothetical protein AURDEDRAFT_168770 [Auricularia subglabra TFB-10046 SS5]
MGTHDILPGLEEMSSGSVDGHSLPRRMSTNDSTLDVFKPRSRSAASPRDSDTSVLRSALGSINALATAPILSDSPRRTPSARRKASRSLPSSPWTRVRPLDDDDEDDPLFRTGVPPVISRPITPRPVRPPSLKYYNKSIHRSRSNPSLSRASSHQDTVRIPAPEVIRVRSRANSVKMQRAEPETESDSARDEDDVSTISHLMRNEDDTEDMNSLLIGPSVPMDADRSIPLQWFKL